MDHPQTQQKPGKSHLAALTWLLLPTQLQQGKMRAGLLANEIRQASHCSWPVRLIASSQIEFFKIALLTESP